MIRLAITLTGAIFLTACSSVSSRVEQPSQLYPYMGVAKANAQIARSWHDPIVPGEVIARVVLDWPFTVVADTVLLPVDAVVAASNASDK